MGRRRRRLAGAALLIAAALAVSACSNTGAASDVTVTSEVTIAPSGGPSTTSPEGSTPGSSTASSSAGSSTVSSPGSSSSSTTAPSSTPSSTKATATNDPAAYLDPKDGVALPDGFVPKKLKAGEHPPQFIVVSFDGVGWDEKWQYWFGIAKKVPFRFTGFLSGTYLLSDQTKTDYHPPFYDPGTSEINWNTAADLPVEINNINTALATGNEIGTHFNGHFCEGAEPSGNQWTTADWNNELDQFYSMIANVKANNPGVQMDDLAFDPKQEVRGERTPCLEGKAEELFPALVDHGITYDSSFTKTGISWPKQSEQYKIWQFGMATFPINGTGKQQITMDYNFYYTQRQASSKDVTPAESAADSEQVYQTYNDMFNATWNGNRAPLVLGNHFNAWNNNAYEDALTKFVLEKCGQPDVQCVPFRDVLAWMSVQDPDRLAQLQAQGPETGSAG